MTATPITPAQAKVEKQDAMPAEVFEAFNELIVQNLDPLNCVSKVTLADAVSLIMSKFRAHGYSYTRQMLYDNHWLDVEPFYRKMGWEVIWDRAAYNESYPSSFTFKG